MLLFKSYKHVCIFLIGIKNWNLIPFYLLTKTWKYGGSMVGTKGCWKNSNRVTPKMVFAFNCILSDYGWLRAIISSFRLALFRLFVISPGVISSFRYFAWRFFVFLRGVISSFRHAITPSDVTKRRKNAMRNNAIINSYFSSFRLALFRLFVISHGVFSSFCVALFRLFDMP